MNDDTKIVSEIAIFLNSSQGQHIRSGDNTLIVHKNNGKFNDHFKLGEIILICIR